MSSSQTYYDIVGEKRSPEFLKIMGNQCSTENQRSTHLDNSNKYLIRSGSIQYPVHSSHVIGIRSGSIQYPVHSSYDVGIRSGSIQHSVYSSHVVGIRSGSIQYPMHLLHAPGFVSVVSSSRATGPILQQDLVITANGVAVRTIRRQF